MPGIKIKVWCLPQREESELKKITHDIIKTVQEFHELKVRGEDDLLILFPPDSMKYELGVEVLIEVLLTETWVPDRETRYRLAENLGATVKTHVPETRVVECIVDFLDPLRHGFWSSKAR